MEIKIVQNLLAANDSVAAENRTALDAAAVTAFNIMGSPGSGKTSLIERAITALRGVVRAAVIEGDIATCYDAERIAKLEVPVVQIATGGECHLDAAMVKQAVEQIDLAAIDVLIIENVGNLVCPSEFDLGEHVRVVVSSFAEGDDKPEKYPQMFLNADAVVLNKLDLAPLVEFNVPAFERRVRDLKPGAPVFVLSCRTGEGIDAWAGWVRARLAA